jgi:hypothetical protein
MSPSPIPTALDAGVPGRSPEGTAMRAALSHPHIAHGPAWGGPALGPQSSCSTHT